MCEKGRGGEEVEKVKEKIPRTWNNVGIQVDSIRCIDRIDELAIWIMLL